MSYLAIKHLHITLAGLSLAGFILRAIWMWQESPRLTARVTRVLPHVIDTALLAAGVFMVYQASVMPWELPWLMAKLVALLVYIVLGSVALKRGPTRQVRAVAALAAIGVFAYMVRTAVAHDPLPF
ncbi:MAG: SirB2 family protein [Gammaproteobacteria bacterium]